MADITSVLEIDIKDDAFRAFKADLDAMKKSMGTMGGGATGTVSGAKARQAANDFDAYSKAMKKSTEALLGFTTQMTKTATNLAVDSGKKLIGAFTSLTKTIVGHGGLLAGIASVASLAGMVGAAGRTQHRMYQAQGLGFGGPQDIARLGVTLGQRMDVAGVAGHLQEEMAKSGSLLVAGLSRFLGVSPQDLKGMSKDELMFGFADYATSQAERPGGMMPSQMEAAGLGFLGVQGQQRMLATKNEAERLRRENEELTKQTQLASPGAWQKFNQFLTGGFLKGETGMMNILTPLLDPLMEVGKVIGKKMEGSNGISTVVDHLQADLWALQNALSTGNWDAFWDRIKKDMKSVFDAIIDVAGPVFEKIGNSLERHFKEAIRPLTEAAEIFKQMLTQLSQSPMATLMGISPVGAVSSHIASNMDLAGLTGSEAAAMRKGSAYTGLFEKYGKQAGVDPTILYGIGMAESRFNPLAKSSKGAGGLMGFMPSTASQYRIDPYDPDQAIHGTSKYQRRLLEMFHGDQTAALAAYNWGEGNVQKAQRRYGEGWLAHAPSETQQYVSNVRRYAEIAGRNLQVSVSAPAGSDVTVNQVRATGAGKGP